MAGINSCYVNFSDFNGWEIFANGGNRFAVEKKPIGSDPITDYAGPNYQGTDKYLGSLALALT